jgi:hypothetical protein
MKLKTNLKAGTSPGGGGGNPVGQACSQVESLCESCASVANVCNQCNF